MRPNHPSSHVRAQSGNRRLFFRYLVLALLVVALVSIVIFGYYKQQRIRQLHASVEALANTRSQVDLIDDAIQHMYAAENQFRFFTLTYRNEYFSQYIGSLNAVAADIDSLQARRRRQGNLKGLLEDKEHKAGVFLQVRLMMDSMLAVNQEWDTTLERTLLQPPNSKLFKPQVKTDTLREGKILVTSAPKKKRLLGRLADAIKNKKGGDTIVEQNEQIVKTSINSDHSFKNAEQELSRIQAYYDKAFRQISQGHANLNEKELEMMLSNDRLLKTMLTGLSTLKDEENEAARLKQLAMKDDISILLNDLDTDTFSVLLLILALTVFILYMLWRSYRSGVRLNKARNHAVQFSKLKSDFVASMSHEIRTPLSSVIGFSEQLGKTRLDLDQEEMVDAINLSANMLLSVVNNVLDFSKLEEDKLKLEKVAFAPGKLIEDISKGLSIQASKKGIELHTHYHFPKEKMVNGDAFRLKQILFNLAGNAIKFTQKGSVTIDASFKTEAGRFILDVAIIDTGIGIEKKYLPRIFEEFTQAESIKDSTVHAEGTGLGLTIVKRIIDLHGGTLTVDSTPGKGSTFRFKIPYKPVDAQMVLITAKANIPSTALPKISHVLVVDDNVLNRRLLEMILQKINVSYLTASNGKEALELLEVNDFDIVLTDIQMPEMDGLTLARIIRRHNDPHKAGLPILAITGNVLKEDLDTYMAAGINSYILKPFKEKEVLEKIRMFREKESIS